MSKKIMCQKSILYCIIQRKHAFIDGCSSTNMGMKTTKVSVKYGFLKQEN